MSAEDTNVTREQIDLETENLIATYDSVAEWIRFADAKAAVVLTVAGALASILIPTLKEYLAGSAIHDAVWNWIVLGLFTTWLLITVWSATSAFRCILPYRKGGQHPALELCCHFHPAAIASKYALDQHQAFVEGYRKAGVSGFQQEVLAGLLIDSHISSSKYTRVTTSIRLLGASCVFAVLYLVAVQF